MGDLKYNCDFKQLVNFSETASEGRLQVGVITSKDVVQYAKAGENFNVFEPTSPPRMTFVNNVVTRQMIAEVNIANCLPILSCLALSYAENEVYMASWQYDSFLSDIAEIQQTIQLGDVNVTIGLDTLEDLTTTTNALLDQSKSITDNIYDLTKKIESDVDSVEKKLTTLNTIETASNTIITGFETIVPLMSQKLTNIYQVLVSINEALEAGAFGRKVRTSLIGSTLIGTTNIDGECDFLPCEIDGEEEVVIEDVVLGNTFQLVNWQFDLLLAAGNSANILKQLSDIKFAIGALSALVTSSVIVGITNLASQITALGDAATARFDTLDQAFTALEDGATTRFDALDQAVDNIDIPLEFDRVLPNTDELARYGGWQLCNKTNAGPQLFTVKYDRDQSKTWYMSCFKADEDYVCEVPLDDEEPPYYIKKGAPVNRNSIPGVYKLAEPLCGAPEPAWP